MKRVQFAGRVHFSHSGLFTFGHFQSVSLDSSIFYLASPPLPKIFAKLWKEIFHVSSPFDLLPMFACWDWAKAVTTLVWAYTCAAMHLPLATWHGANSGKEAHKLCKRTKKGLHYHKTRFVLKRREQLHVVSSGTRWPGFGNVSGECAMCPWWWGRLKPQTAQQGAATLLLSH